MDVTQKLDVDKATEMMEAGKTAYLAQIVEHTYNGFALLEMTNEDVAKVGLNVMLNSFLEGFGQDISKATNAMESFVARTLQAMRHNEATRLVLPPGVGKH